MLVSHLGINQAGNTAASKLPDHYFYRCCKSNSKRLLLGDFLPWRIERTQFNAIPDIDLDLGTIDLKVNSDETRSEAFFILYIACLISVAAIFVINPFVPRENQVQVCY